MTSWLRRVYDWVLGWADHPYSTWALFGIAFAESSFFPIPPDVLLIALAVSIPARAFRFALLASAGSLLGGAFGYYIGHEFYSIAGEPIIRFYSAEGQYENIAQLFSQYDVWVVAAAAFTPIPYKVATITAGFMDLNFLRFFLVSAVGRSLRFFLIGGLIWKFGPEVRAFIERYFEILSIVGLAMLIGGFIILGWWTGS